MKLSLISLAILILTGCAASPTDLIAANTNAATDGRFCERLYPVGSNIPTKRCFTEEEMRLKREAAAKGVDDVHDSMNRTYSKPMGAGS